MSIFGDEIVMAIGKIEEKAMQAAAVFRRLGVSQAQVAEMVGASQGQVSRLLNGKNRRPSRLFKEVCLLAARLEGGVSKTMVIENEELVSALAETWDGTAAHAKALAVVIRSLAAFKS